MADNNNDMTYDEEQRYDDVTASPSHANAHADAPPTQDGDDTSTLHTTVDDSDTPAKEKRENAQTATSGMLKGKTIEQIVEREAREEQDSSNPFSLSKTLGGVIVARAFHHQIGLVLFIGVFLLIYISFGYVCQKRITDIERMEIKLKHARYKSTVAHSMLTEMSRESNIMNRLSQYGDSTLTIPQEPPYLIKVNE